MHLVPYPQHLTRGRGTYDIGTDSGTLVLSDTVPACIRHKLSELSIPFTADRSDAPRSFVLGEAPDPMPRAPRKSEGYRLVVTKRGIAVVGHDTDGLYWGLTTLQQLANGGRRVPCVDIRDWPRFALRYHHDDISRKQVSKLSDFKRIIRLLSYYKIKYYTPYMEDMLYLKSYPDIGEGRGRLTPAEVQGMLSEADKYNVTVFPTFSLIGHQENLLQNPKYRKYAREVFQEPSSYDPSKKFLRPYLRKVIRDVCELFPDSPFFHACFDETQGVGERELTSHANWCANEIATHGKKMLMWVDMWKNHFGIEHLKGLSDTIIPVEWNYGSPSQFEQAYVKAGVIPTGLAGYNNWCCFLPDFSRGKRCIEEWARVMKRWKGEGFGCSMWGDNGYENSRDLSWNLFAFLGEVTWRGAKAAPQFEDRFQTTFYGTTLPRIKAIVEDLPGALRISAGQSWRWFRYSMQAMVRLCASDATLAQKCQSDLKRLRTALDAIVWQQGRALREKDHLDHFSVALEREISVRERLVLASRVAGGLQGVKLSQAVVSQLSRLDRLKRHYRRAWLRNNKRENIEVSLAVYDAVVQSLIQLVTPQPEPARTYECLVLDTAYNTLDPAVGGLPMRNGTVNGVPFTFAPITKTHCALELNSPVTVPFTRAALRDLHLVYGGQTLDKKRSHAVVKVELLRGKTVVFSEKLQSITQVCDWWAPLGEHMWAGGGYKYVDRKRNTYGLKPGENYGLMHLHGFALRKVGEVDALRITRIASEDFNLFAATVEHRK